MALFLGAGAVVEVVMAIIVFRLRFVVAAALGRLVTLLTAVWVEVSAARAVPPPEAVGAAAAALATAGVALAFMAPALTALVGLAALPALVGLAAQMVVALLEALMAAVALAGLSMEAREAVPVVQSVSSGLAWVAAHHHSHQLT